MREDEKKERVQIYGGRRVILLDKKGEVIMIMVKFWTFPIFFWKLHENLVNYNKNGSLIFKKKLTFLIKVGSLMERENKGYKGLCVWLIDEMGFGFWWRWFLGCIKNLLRTTTFGSNATCCCSLGTMGRVKKRSLFFAFFQIFSFVFSFFFYSKTTFWMHFLQKLLFFQFFSFVCVSSNKNYDG